MATWIVKGHRKTVKDMWTGKMYEWTGRVTIVDDAKGDYSPKHVICTVAKNHPEAAFNARLIAAAPELYEVAELECAKCKKHPFAGMDCTVCLIGRALRKAKGEGVKVMPDESA